MVHRYLFRNNKWNWLIILIISLLFITVIVFLGIKSNNEVQNIVQKQFSEQQLLLSKQVSAGIKEFLNEKTIIIEILAKHTSEETPDTLTTEFMNVYNESGGIYVIEFINESGIVTTGYPEENTPSGYDLFKHDQAWPFERVRTKKETYITRPLPLFEGELGVFIWTPVYKGNEFKGAILAIIKTSDISNRFLKNYNSPGDIYMVDDHGTILYSGSNNDLVGENYPETLNGTSPLLQQILSDQMNGTEGTGYYYESNISDKKLIAYSPIKWRNQNWSVAVTSPVSEINALINSVYVKQGVFIGVAGGFIILGSLSIILLLSRWNKSLELEVSRKTSELQESNELLQNANQKLMELDRLKSDFLSMVSHELKTPLTAMKVSSEFLLEDDPKPSVRKELIELIIRNIDRLTRMVNDLLDTSRVESGKLRYRKAMVDLRDIIATATGTINKQSEKKGLRITTDIPDNLPKIHADKDRLIQVFVNLLSNALKFTHNGGNVEIRAIEFEKYIEVHMKDDGIGIPPDKLDKIFNKFYQIDNTSSRTYGGSGLGLAITRGIVEGHGGTIKVESTPGMGCLFILTFNK